MFWVSIAISLLWFMTTCLREIGWATKERKEKKKVDDESKVSHRRRPFCLDERSCFLRAFLRHLNENATCRHRGPDTEGRTLLGEMNRNSSSFDHGRDQLRFGRVECLKDSGELHE